MQRKFQPVGCRYGEIIIKSITNYFFTTIQKAGEQVLDCSPALWCYWVLKWSLWDTLGKAKTFGYNLIP